MQASSNSDLQGKPAVLIAAHGERGGSLRNERLKLLAATVREKLPGFDIVPATIAGEPRLADAFDSIRSASIIAYPFFMANGYFVDEVLKSHLEASGKPYQILPPLGTDDGFIEMTANQIGSIAGARPSKILIVAHGSAKDSRSRMATERFTSGMEKLIPGLPLANCYLEEPPFADDAISKADNETLIVSLFAGDGLHAAGDLPEILERRGKSHLPVAIPAAETKLIAGLISARVISALKDDYSVNVAK